MGDVCSLPSAAAAKAAAAEAPPTPPPPPDLSTMAMPSMQERTFTKQKEEGSHHHHTCRGDHRYIWEEEGGGGKVRLEKTEAVETTRCCQRQPSKLSATHGGQTSAPPKLAAAFQQTRKHQDTIAVSSRTTSPAPASGFAASLDHNRAERRSGSEDSNPQHRTSTRGENNGVHDGRSRKPRREMATSAVAGGAVLTLPPPRWRKGGGEGGGDEVAVSSEAIERHGDGVSPVQQGETVGRLKPQNRESFGGSGDGCTSSSWSSSREDMRAVVEIPKHQAAAAAIERRTGLPPSSPATQTSDRREKRPQQAMHWHRHEEGQQEYRRSKPDPELVGVGLGRDIGGDSYRHRRGEDEDGEGRRAASVTAADVAAAAKAAAVSFALGSPVSQSSLPRRNQPQPQPQPQPQQQPQPQPQQQQHQHRQELEQRQYHHVHRYADHQGHHQQEQAPSPLSSLSWPTDIRTPPQSDWCTRSGRQVDPCATVSPAAAASAGGGGGDPGRTSQAASGNVYGSSVSSSRSRSHSSSFATGYTPSSASSKSSRRRRWRPPGTILGGVPTSGFAPSPTSGPVYQQPPGRPVTDDQHGSEFLEPLLSTGPDPAAGGGSWAASRPAASNTPGSSVFSSESGYRCGSQSSQGYSDSSSSRPGTVSTETSGRGASSIPGGSASRLERRRTSREGGGDGSGGGGGSAGCPRHRLERPDGARLEATMPPRSRDSGERGQQGQGHGTGQQGLLSSLASSPTRHRPHSASSRLG